jgi:hypothetical protein
VDFCASPRNFPGNPEMLPRNSTFFASSLVWRTRINWSIVVLEASMNCVIRLSLLVLALTCTSSWAQGRSMTNNPMSGSGFGPVATSRPANGFVVGHGRPGGPGRPGWCNRGNCSGNRGEWNNYWPGYWGYGPYSYGGLDPYWEIGEPAEPQSSPSQQPVIVYREAEQKAVSAPVASPKVIEVPLQKTADGKQLSPANPVPPAVFILTNGQRVEAKQYLLTQDMLQIQHGRDQQNIPLNQVNLEATIAANQARGIALQIPENRNHLTLGF